MAGSPFTTTATVKGGYFEVNGVTSLTQVGRGAHRRRIAQQLAHKGMMGIREIMETLNGATAGSAASKTLGRVVASSELGGTRAIESETLVSANTHADDVTRINAQMLALSTKTYDPTPVANLDGNPLGTR